MSTQQIGFTADYSEGDCVQINQHKDHNGDITVTRITNNTQGFVATTQVNGKGNIIHTIYLNTTSGEKNETDHLTGDIKITKVDTQPSQCYKPTTPSTPYPSYDSFKDGADLIKTVCGANGTLCANSAHFELDAFCNNLHSFPEDTRNRIYMKSSAAQFCYGDFDRKKVCTEDSIKSKICTDGITIDSDWCGMFPN
jgi:hypothetical protein